MNIFLFYVGMILLYLPPLIVYSFPNLVDKIVNKIPVIIVSTVLTILMLSLMPEVPSFVFLFYLGTFNLIFMIYNKFFDVKGEAVRVAIYSCFAISVLWEWPIQLTQYQNWIAVLISGFKALGIPFLYITLKARGYKLNYKHFLLVGLIILEGMMLTYNLTYMSVENLYTVLHFYRVYWLILILYLIGVTAKKKSLSL